VGIDEVPRQVTFERRPVELRTAPKVSDIGFEPIEVTVIVEGAPALVAELDAGDVIPFVRVKETPPQEGKVIDILVDLPEGISVSRVEPASVFVFNEANRKLAMKSRAEKSLKKSSK
jgi:hypothetical protein